MEEERDLVTFTDDDGNEMEMEVIDYFDYEDDEYAVLIEAEEAECDCEEEECDCEHDVYIMKVVANGEYEEFLPPDDDKMEILAAIVEKRFEEDGEEDECECDCESGECDCGEHACHHGEKDCGCHKEN